MEDRKAGGGMRRSFRTTRWSVVRAAGRSDPDASREALGTLCRDYWFPLYAYLRRRGHGDDEARELVQAFLARVLERRDLGGATREAGRFRNYLLGALKHFLSHQRQREEAQKRGGHLEFLSLEFGDPAGRYAREPADPFTPETLFQRQWAVTLLGRARDRLARSYRSRGKASLFQELSPLLAGESDEAHAALAERLGISEGALNVALHRLRRRYREAVRAEIGDTVSDEKAVDDELRALRAVLET